MSKLEGYEEIKSVDGKRHVVPTTEKTEAIRKEINSEAENHRSWCDMRILWHSTSPHLTSGYGVVTKQNVGRMLDNGLNVFVSTYYGVEGPGYLVYDGITVMPTEKTSVDKLGFKSASEHYKRLQCDVGIFASDFWVSQQFAKLIEYSILHSPIDMEDYPDKWLDVARTYKWVTIPSKHGVNEMKKGGIDAKFIPHGVDDKVFSPYDKQQSRSALTLDKEDFIVGMVAANNDMDRKGFDSNFMAFKLFLEQNPDAKDAKLLIHTHPNSVKGINLFELSKTIGVHDNIIWTGAYSAGVTGLPDKVMAKFYSAIDVFLLLSRREGFCLTPTMPIHTNSGIKEIQNVKIGEKVLTHTGKYQRVQQVMCRDIKEKIIKITPWNLGDSLYLTKEHPVFAVLKTQGDKATWIEAQDLRKGDKVFIPNVKETKFKEFFDLTEEDSTLLYNNQHVWYEMGFSPKTCNLKRYNRYIKNCKDLHKLFGIYTAGGSVNSNRSAIAFTFHNKQIELAMEVQELFRKLFGIDSSIIKVKDKNLVTVIVCGKIIVKFFSSRCGFESKTKKIPLEILRGPKENLEILLDYLYICDGNENKTNYSLSTSSNFLYFDVFLALVRLGKTCNKHRCRNRENEMVITFMKKIGKQHSNKCWSSDNGTLFLIKNVEEVEYEGKVMNLEVEEDNSFVSLFTVHNCLPALESQCCGTPCILNEYSAMIERNDYGRVGWLCKPATYYYTALNAKSSIPDPHRGAEALGEAYNKPKKLKQFSKKARDYALKQTWDIAVNDYWMPFLETVGESIPHLATKGKVIKLAGN